MFARRYRFDELLTVFGVIALILIAIVSSAIHVYAAAPTLTWKCNLNAGENNFGISASGTATLDLTNGCGAFNPNANPNGTIILLVSCSPSTATPTTISDNNGLAWGVIFPTGGAQPIGQQVNSMMTFIAFAPFTTTPFTNELATMNFVPSYTYCAVTFFLADQILGLVNSASTVSIIVTPTNSDGGGKTLTLPTITQPANSLALAFMVTAAPQSGSVTCSSPASPLSVLQINGLNCFVFGFVGQFGGTLATAGNLNFAAATNYITSQTDETYSATFHYNTFAVYSMILATFSTTGTLPTCASSNQAITVGSASINTAANTPLTANRTFLYTAIANSLGGEIVNSSLTLSSVSLTNGQTQATLTIAIYTSPIPNAPLGSNPFVRQSQVTFTVKNSVGSQQFNWVPNVAVPAGGSVAVGIGITHTGANIYRTLTTGLTLDFVAAFVGPATISLFTGTTTPLQHFFGTFAQACANQIVTTSTFNTNLSTLLINQPPPTNGGSWFPAMLFLLLIPSVFIGMYVILVARRQT